MWKAFFFLSLALFLASTVYSQTSDHAHNVTLVVPQVLSLEVSAGDLQLVFEGQEMSSETNSLSVNYSVFANGLLPADGTAVLFTELDFGLAGIDYKAAFGVYIKTGGSAELAPITPGHVTVEDTPTPLASKSYSVGDGKVLNGTFPISYKAVATEDLSGGSSLRQIITTLTDI